MTKKEQEFFFIEFYVAGYCYYDGQKIEDSLLEGKEIRFQREPHCIHDSKAVEIYAGRKKIGYIPRRDNAIFSSLLDQGIPIKGIIRKRNFDDRPDKRVKIAVFKN